MAGFKIVCGHWPFSVHYCDMTTQINLWAVILAMQLAAKLKLPQAQAINNQFVGVPSQTNCTDLAACSLSLEKV